MAFVRVKKIKQNEYAYLVENHWTKGASRQKVVAYLGRVIRHDPQESRAFPLTGSFSERLHALAESTLLAHGYSLQSEQFLRDALSINKTTKEVLQNNKPAVLQLNEGFLCKMTWDNLLALSNSATVPLGSDVAKRILDAGLPITPEGFIVLYETLQEEHLKREPTLHL